MNSWKGLLACAVVAGVIVALLLRGDGRPHHEAMGLIGNPAPDFRGDFALNGDPINLSALKGKVVLVDFWATWCRPCVEALPHLIALNHKYKSAGLEVVGVTMYNNDEPAALQRAQFTKFVERHNMDYLVMALDNKDAARTLNAYGVNGIPQVVLIDRLGVVRHVLVGGGEESEREIDSAVTTLLAE
jgi:thiol-disulfide isomerase/thioredoxin